MTAQPNGMTGVGINARQMRAILDKFAAMPIDSRLAFAMAIDPKAGTKTCSKCKIVKVYSNDPARSEFRKSARGDSVGFAHFCKDCADLAPSRAKYRHNDKVAVQVVPTPVKRGKGRPKGTKDSKPRIARASIAIVPSDATKAIDNIIATMTTTGAPNTPVSVPSVFSQTTPAPDDLIWVGDDAYNRHKIVQVRRLDIDGKPALSVVLDAIEHDPRTGVSKSICIDLFSAEVDEFTAQLRGEWGNLVSRLRLMRGEVDSACAAAEKWEAAYRETLAERDAARKAHETAEQDAIKHAGTADEAQRRLDNLVKRLAAAGIKIDLD